MKAPHRLPPLNALRAFEAVTRHLSFARAADELFVTKAAVAQQVRQLEEEIGAQLVEREGRGLRLTDAGQAGMRDLSDGFAILGRAATRDARMASRRRFLVIHSQPVFRATWLVGRIGKFKAQHPEIDVLLDINPMEEALERASASVDALIRCGTEDFPGFSTTLLFQESVFPVCAPWLAKGGHPIEKPQDLAALAGDCDQRMERELFDMADLGRLADGRRRVAGRCDARRVVQLYVDGLASGRAGAGGGADHARHRRR